MKKKKEFYLVVFDRHFITILQMKKKKLQKISQKIK